MTEKKVCQALRLTAHIPFSFPVMALHGKMTSQSMRNGMQFRILAPCPSLWLRLRMSSRRHPSSTLRPSCCHFVLNLLNHWSVWIEKKVRVSKRISNYTEKCAKFFFRQIKLTVLTFITKPEIIYLPDLVTYIASVFLQSNFFLSTRCRCRGFFLERNAQIRKEARKKLSFPSASECFISFTTYSLYRPGQPNWEYNMWKFRDFSAIQILRELNFGLFEAPITAILTIWAV